jgi:hypothetical protein
LRVADEAATPRFEPTTTTLERPDKPEELTIAKRETMSSFLDLRDPHWTEMRQQQMLHEAQIPPQPLLSTETNPSDDIKK